MIAQISEIITEYFVQGISVWVAAGILTLVSLGGSQNVQARGRFAETAWPVVCLLVGGDVFSGGISDRAGDVEGGRG